MDIGKRIKSCRKELGLSAEVVAERMGVSAATVYRYESNYISNMRVDKVTPIAKALNTSEAYLMGWTEDKSPSFVGGTPCVDNIDPAITAIMEILQSSNSDIRLRLFDLVSDYVMCNEFEQGKISTMATMLAFDHRDSKSADDVDKQYYDYINNPLRVGESTMPYGVVIEEDIDIITPHEYHGEHEDLVREIRNRDVEETLEELERAVKKQEKISKSLKLSKERPAK